jgi:hypothetical protein
VFNSHSGLIPELPVHLKHTGVRQIVAIFIIFKQLALIQHAIPEKQTATCPRSLGDRSAQLGAARGRYLGGVGAAIGHHRGDRRNYNGACLHWLDAPVIGIAADVPIQLANHWSRSAAREARQVARGAAALVRGLR